VPLEIVSAHQDADGLGDAMRIVALYGERFPGADRRVVQAQDMNELADTAEDGALMVVGAPGGSWLRRSRFGSGARIKGAARAGAVMVKSAADRVYRFMGEPVYPPSPGVDIPRRGTVTVSVDGREAGRCLLGGRWTRATFRLPAGELAELAEMGPGLHRVAVRWPMPPPVGEAALEGAKSRLAEGVEADLHPVFGEVFSLRVLPGGPRSSPGR
jgi:hypothetical protein